MIQASFAGGPEGLRRLPFPGAVRVASGGTALPVPAERFRAAAPGSGFPLPAVVQSRMEAYFGADFSRVRIHVDERAAAMGALAFAHGSALHFAPGRYDPVSPAGRRLLAHELAHVVQQRAGRARNPFPSGVALVSDPALEAEAERMALRAAGAFAAPSPASFISPISPTSGTRVAQPYFKIKSGQVFTSPKTLPRDKGQARALVPEKPSFEAQVKGGNEFLTTTGKVRIEAGTRVALRVSDDHQMAIEDTDLSGRQPKVFFATNKVIRASNAALDRVSSGFRLAQGGRSVRILSAAGVEHTLWAVYPLARTVRRLPELSQITTNQNCNDLATAVIGIKTTSHSVMLKPPPGVPSGVGTINQQIHYTVADLVAKVLRKGETGFVYDMRRVATHMEWKTGEGEKKMRLAIDQISREYSKAMAKGSADDLLAKWGINRHAAPAVGDAFVIHSVAAENEGQITDWDSERTIVPKWPYHWGGVVARSGADVVTLENYARESGGSKSADPRWYFQMYGEKPGQSFHEAWKATGEFANPVTLTMRNPQRKPPSRLSAAQWTLILIALVIVVLLGRGLLIRRVWG
ncbi:MAG TPA: DUF4157 domain-containing protein [Thermoanaerobaculia bacterium]|nr:DUF4157 domain-containing protein [Thermoanaerobaculia bacterium]